MFQRPAAQILLALTVMAPALMMGACADSEGADTLKADELALDAQAAVERSLPLLQQSARFWTDEVGCFSCHHQGLGAVGIAVAREVGFTIDEVAADTEAATVREYSLERYEPLLNCDGVGVFGRSAVLLGLGAREWPKDDVTDVVAHFLAARQTVTGAWYSNEHRPPFEDSHVTATALTVRALQLYGPEGRAAEMEHRVDEARRYLEGYRPRDTEERSMRLLGMAWCESDDELIQEAAADLLAQQQANGGWRQIETRASDPYATGQALVALNQAAGMQPRELAWRRGIRFLISTQHEDGSWSVSTRRRIKGLPYRESGFPYGRNQFISYFGSVWATIALALDRHGASRTRTLFGPGPARNTDDTTACEQGLSEMHCAAAFGSVDDVRRELESGADPNVRGPRGLTPLMLAVHDEEKVDLLLARGANPYAESEWGFTTLLAASFTSGAGSTVDRLLALDVAVDCRGVNGASPLFCAANIGDVETLHKLYAADAQFPIGYQQHALVYAATCDDVEMARALIELGANIDSPIGVGQIPLTSAVIAGYEKFAGFMIEMGANPDIPDMTGMSALSWAAKVDPGHSRVVKMLVDAGADIEHRSENGWAPLDWALEYRNEHHARVLRAAGATGN